MDQANIMQQLYAVIGALNNITVSGKANLNNLIGSISVLETIVPTLHSAGPASHSGKD